MSARSVSVCDRRRLPFVMVTKAALEVIRAGFDGRRGPVALAIYVALVECANDARSDSFAVLRRDLAGMGMVELKALERYVPELERLGLVRVESGKQQGAPNVWTLTDPPAVEGTCPGHVPGTPSAHAPGAPSEHAGGTPPGHAPLVNGVKKKKKKDSLSNDREVDLVFDTWVSSTRRNRARAKLTDDRRRRIEKALASHGLQDCLAAVRNIGADSWAAGENDRGRPFNDIEHALGSTKRIEEWRDRAPVLCDDRAARRARRGQALAGMLAGEGVAA